MKILTIPQPTTPSHITKHTTLHPSVHHHHHPFPPTRTRRLRTGAKGFSGSPSKDSIAVRKTPPKRNNNEEDDDDKLPEVVWERMISRILFYVGVPLVAGFVFLQAFSVLKERGVWNVPVWVPYLTTFITFGASALGVAYGSLSTSLDAKEEGTLLGFEQVEKNWVEMWEQDDVES